MKFSFEYQKYRDELADNIKRKRKESRGEVKQLLEKEKETAKYQITEKATRINQGIKRLTNDGFENPDSSYERGMEFDCKYPDRIFEDKLTGRKMRRILIDISKIIPEEIKLLLDKWRIDEINKLNKTNNQEHNLEHNLAINRDFEDIASLNKKAEEFINEITEGDYNNPAILNTVKDAYKDGRAMKENKLVELKEIKRYGTNVADKISVPVNKRYSSIFGKTSQPIWFAAGGSHFFKAHSLIFLFDPHSARFKDAVAEIVEYAGSGYYSSINYNCIADKYDENFDELYKKAIEYASKDQTGGIALRFKDEMNIDNIAKWIVDLQRGILIKIEDVESANYQNG